MVSRRFCSATRRTYATGFSGGARMVSAVPVATQTWARLAGCQRGMQARPISENVTRFTYTDCRDNVTVGLYRIADGSHGWPAPTGPPHGPEATQEIDASRIMWAFFERHRR